MFWGDFPHFIIDFIYINLELIKDLCYYKYVKNKGYETMNELKAKEVFKELNEKFDDYEEIKENLRSLNSCEELSDAEYDYILENWDNLLVELGYMDSEMLEIMKRI